MLSVNHSRALLALLALAFSPVSYAEPIPSGYAPEEGDVVFQSLPRNPLVDAIEGCTGSPFSHCGLVVKKGDGWAVLEAMGPVKETPLGAWAGRGRTGLFVACRMKAGYRSRIPELITAARSYMGKPYDIHYRFDDSAIYCSELVFKAFKTATGEALGETKKLGDLNWRPHEAFIRQVEGGGLPLEREMITPADLAVAPQLEKVFARKP